MSLVLEDLEMILQGNTNSRILINDIVLIILLFADDMTIFGNNPEDLHNNLNLLHDYCNTCLSWVIQSWYLEEVG